MFRWEKTRTLPVYLSPSSVKRITGVEGGRGKWVKYQGVVVEYNGKIVATYSSERGKMEKMVDHPVPQYRGDLLLPPAEQG